MDLPKKRQRREGYYRYGDENEKKPSGLAAAIGARTKSTPTRVFPNVPGFGPLSRSEVKQDSLEIEKQSGLASDHTDSEDDEDSKHPNGIFRSLRPPCAPESTLFKKRERYFHWAKNPASMAADLTKYRNCVSHLQQELAQLSGDQQRWEDNFKLSRGELSSLYSNYSASVQTLQTESEMLTSLLQSELQTEGQDENEESVSDTRLVEMALSQLADYDSQILKMLKSDLVDKESIPEHPPQQQPPPRNNKRKSSSASASAAVADHGTKVFAFTPPSPAEPSEESPSPDDVSESIASIHSKLFDFLESWKKNGGNAAFNDEAMMESRYTRVLEQLTEESAGVFPALKSSIHSGCLENEKEASFFASSPFPEIEIRQHLREYLNPNQDSQQQINSATPAGESNGSVAPSRGTRRRKPMTTRHSQQSTQLQLTALRRTPQNQPLFLTPTSPFEDYYGGIILRVDNGIGEGRREGGMDMAPTVDNLFSQDFSPPSSAHSASGNPIPLAEMESLYSRLNQSKACLQRGIHTLNALEREKLEWLSQLEKLKETSTKDLLETELGLMKPIHHQPIIADPIVAVVEKNETVAGGTTGSGGGGNTQKNKSSGATNGKNSKGRGSSTGGGVSDPPDVLPQQESLPQTAAVEAKKESQQEAPAVAATAKETKKASSKKPPAKKRSR